MGMGPFTCENYCLCNLGSSFQSIDCGSMVKPRLRKHDVTYQNAYTVLILSPT
uniref:Chloroplast photosystem I P700 apoprotein A2 n=1 Tax=Rhizophora mucronata TaxID=61149 RepID=A0A2P2PLB0_RHIMU